MCECFSKRKATFLILGPACTRSCRFCSVAKGVPLPADVDEKENIVACVSELGLEYVVITSVTRDDLADGGASHFAAVIRRIKAALKSVKVEVLVPDFNGNTDSVKIVMDAGPDILGHNIETVGRLYPTVRQGADYHRSLRILKSAKENYPNKIIKSGIMLGLGETDDEICSAMKDIKETGCDILTIGQYLSPSKDNFPVKRFVAPAEFKKYEEIGMNMGFGRVVSGPFVRSSYLAEETYNKTKGSFYGKCNTAAVG